MTKNNNLKPQSELTENIFDRIERENIAPLSRTIYLLENITFWVLWVFSVLLGAFAVAVLIFTELNIGWEFYEMTHDNAVTFFVHSLPYLWLVLFLLVVLWGPYNLKHTKQGYRYSLGMIMFLGLSLSILFGILLNTYGLGKYIDETIGAKLPLHTSVLHMRERFWQQPERGIYNGVIESIDSEKSVFTMLTTEGTSVTFNLRFIPQQFLQLLEPDTQVRVLATSSKTYEQVVACNLMTWEEEVVETLSDIRKRRDLINESLNMKMRTDDTRPQAENPCIPPNRPRP